MNAGLVRALSALAVGGLGFSLATAAQAATVQFASTVTFTETVDNVSFSSLGLNANLTVGTPTVISQFITVDIGNGGTFSAVNESLQANFLFTIPTPTGATTDNGTVNGGQINGGSRLGTLSIVWPGQPVHFLFADGTNLDVTLDGLSKNCTGNGCLDAAGPYYMSATFLALNGPTDNGNANGPGETPLPAALPLFASGAGVLGFLGWRRKRKAQAA